jgi:diguanylate cyclase (GGDEF)-like protein
VIAFSFGVPDEEQMLIENLTSGPADILIVDDTPGDVAGLLAALEKEGHRCRVAASEAEAFATIASTPPDLILLDAVLTGSDGYEICRRLKADHGTARVPVVFIASADAGFDRERASEAGGADYVSFPLHPSEIRSRVRDQVKITRLAAALEVLATHDGLTGLANRRQFESTLLAEWNRASRKSDPVAILLVDVDGMKLYNDSHGHAAGDSCLKRVAGALQGALTRATDVVARYAGETFAVILPGAESEEAHRQGERLRQAVRDLAIPFENPGVAEVLTVSVGAASIRPAAEILHSELVAAAEDALYRAKHQGRDRTETVS